MISARLRESGPQTVVATIDIDGASEELWWEVGAAPAPVTAAQGLPAQDAAVPAAGAALLAAMLLPAMLGGHHLRIDAPVSAGVVAAAEAVGEVFTTWSRRRQLETGEGPGYRPVRIDSSDAGEAPGAPQGVAAFFSAGVDSFHTVLRHRARLDALVYVVGFDVRLGDPALPLVLAHVRTSASMLGLPLIEVRTNLRDVVDPLVPWDDQHGAALASVALLLGDRFAEVLVPSTHTFDDLYPLGSHPVVDPLWSTGATRVVNDGAGVDRAGKLGAIASVPAARQHLRVCFQFPDGATNCGRCEKCVRTLVGIRLAGVDGAFVTLPSPGGLALAARVVRTVPRNRASTWRWYQLQLRTEGRDPAVRLAVGLAMWRWRLRRWRARWRARWRVRRRRGASTRQVVR